MSTKIKVTLGLFSKADDRIYTKDSIEMAVKSFNERIEENGFVTGSLRHGSEGIPVSGWEAFTMPSRIETLLNAEALENATHKITSASASEDGKKITGEIELLNTPNGRLVKDMLSDGVKLYMSPRVIIDDTADDSGENVERLDSIMTFDITDTPIYEGGEELEINAKFNR